VNAYLLSELRFLQAEENVNASFFVAKPPLFAIRNEIIELVFFEINFQPFDLARFGSAFRSLSELAKT